MSHRMTTTFQPIIRRLGKPIELRTPSIKYSGDYIYRVTEGFYTTQDGKYKIKKQNGR